jgi:hypothetical protein
MGVCEVVVRMAEAVAVARQPLTAREACWLHLLRGITAYQGIGRLDLWEAACNEVSPATPESVTEKLLEEIQMLGLANLYQAFSELRTQEFYAGLVPFFEEHGICIPTSPDLSEW